MEDLSVVITGIGLVTPLGDTIESFWEAVSQGRNLGFNVKKQYSGCDRFIHFALDAAKESICDARLSQDILKRAGVTISSSKGGIGYPPLPNPLPSRERCPKVLSRAQRGGRVRGLQVYPNMAAVRCAEHFGCCGPCVNVISACATGLNSIIMGAGFIKTGRTKVVLTGGTDACLTEFIISAYERLGVLAREYCRPYDKRRNGFRLSEGAAVVVLEEKTHAQRRRAKVYGEITGWASLSDAYHITSLNPDAETIKEAIRLTGAEINNIDYINTHGTGTVENDIIETLALKEALGKEVYNIPLSSTKAVTGHMLGASGAVEFIIGLLAMKEGFVPPTMNLEEPDPRCDLDYTPLVGRRHEIRSFLTLSYGFGGHVCAVEVKKI